MILRNAIYYKSFLWMNMCVDGCGVKAQGEKNIQLTETAHAHIWTNAGLANRQSNIYLLEACYFSSTATSRHRHDESLSLFKLRTYNKIKASVKHSNIQHNNTTQQQHTVKFKCSRCGKKGEERKKRKNRWNHRKITNECFTKGGVAHNTFS